MKTNAGIQNGRRINSRVPYRAVGKLICLFMLSTSYFVSGAQMAAVDSRHLNLEKGLAISGYDPVAYFTEGKAVQGKNSISYTFKGATYYFSSEADKQLFVKEPAKYEPQYGGWCAYAMATKGEKVEIDPQTFKIVNGKLLLFYNKYFTNTLTSWNKNERTLLPEADSNWLKIIQK